MDNLSACNTLCRLEQNRAHTPLSGNAQNAGWERACWMRGERMACSWLRSSCPSRSAFAAKSSSTCEYHLRQQLKRLYLMAD